jgi:hypothetical protein
MTMPTERDINIYNSLDEITARDHFLNKTVEEAEELFREDSAVYQEDLMWMGPRAFHYYLQSVINYLKSEHAAGDDHLISCLHGILRFRSEQEGISSLATDRGLELVDYVISNYDKFDVDTNAYGDLLAKYQQLNIDLRHSK